ncbi:MAG: toll/interleukin-1 receptor domain-containing protein [Phycisphaerales bacterium]|nr:toll/interleukin-1 receptor domain-containing protein [Phycisphaerales bacterium]
MPRLPKHKAVALIEQLISSADSVRSEGESTPAFKRWHRDGGAALRNLFGDDSHQFKDWQDTSYSPIMFWDNTPDHVFRDSFQRGCDSALAILKSAVTEIETFWDDAEPTLSIPSGDASMLKVFFSHSSRDLPIVACLVDLLKSALRLKDSDIRCTSLDGYRLPGGTSVSDQLRREVHDAEVLIAVVSADSLRSTYTVFEMGARWGANKKLIPVLDPTFAAANLEGPLSELNALSCASRPQLQQLVEDVAAALGVSADAPSAYDSKIESVLQLKHSAPIAATTGQRGGDGTLDADGDQILLAISQLGGGQEVLLRALESKFSHLGHTRLSYYIDILETRHYIDGNYNFLHSKQPRAYTLKAKGRAHLVDKGLV